MKDPRPEYRLTIRLFWQGCPLVKSLCFQSGRRSYSGSTENLQACGGLAENSLARVGDDAHQMKNEK
jgi:hypothetical protein